MQRKLYALHPAQQDIYLDQLINMYSTRYNTGGYTTLTGTLDKEKFIASVTSVPLVFDVFRMRFDADPERPGYYMDETYTSFAVAEMDFSNYPHPQNEAELWIQQQCNIPFDIAGNGLLFQQYLLTLSENEHWIFLKIHHLLCDGFGLSVWAQYISAKYLSLLENDGREFYYPSYKDETIRAVDYQHSPDYVKDGDYWKGKISEKPQKLLQKKHPAYTAAQQKNGSKIIKLSAAQDHLISHLKQEAGCSIQQLTIAALIIYFANTTADNTFVFGLPIHKRRTRQQRNIMGMFSGDIAFKGSYRPNIMVIDLIREIAASQKRDYRHQQYLIGDLANHLHHKASGDRLFDVMINHVLFNFDLYFGDGIQARTYEALSEHEKYPLQLWWKDYGARQPLELRMDFQYEYFNDEEAAVMADRIFHLFEQFSTSLNREVASISMLLPGEQARLLGYGSASGFGPAASPFSFTRQLEHRFYSCGGDAAITCNGRTCTYGELMHLSRALALGLRQQHGLRKGDRVAVLLERNEWMVITLVSLLTNGLVYVPIDNSYPQQRIHFLLQDVQPSLVIADGPLQEMVRHQGFQAVTPASLLGGGADGGALPPSAIGSEDTAYIIYTSGSTGHPKGVRVSHGNLNHFLGHVCRRHVGSAGLTMPFVASHAFDISLFQVLTPLLSGGCCVVVAKEGLQDMEVFAGVLGGVTAIDTVPAVYQGLCNHLQGQGMQGLVGHIRRVFIGGDRISDGLLRQMGEVFSGAVVVVTYGPTEGTIFCTEREYGPGEIGEGAKGSMIGRAIVGSRVYVMNGELQLVGEGMEGEICIGGGGVAQGYYGREELSGERFVGDGNVEGGRMYRSGDLGRWGGEGVLEFRGRLDDQVKIRGYRIEPAEIEASIKGHPDIAEAMVTAGDGADEEKSLTAYYIPRQPVQVWPSISEYLGYNDVAYYAMNTDESRAGSYKKAIYEAVKNKVVVDVGTGPEAILAQHCIAAGASKVYAIEILEEVYLKAKQKIEEMGLKDKIILIHGDVLNVDLPEKADYCVCALVGNMGSSDGCIPVMNSARRFLKDAACMIPCRSRCNIAAISIPDHTLSYRFTETGAYYVNNIFRVSGAAFDLRIGLQHVREDNLVSTTGVFEDLDLTADLPENEEHGIELQVTADAVMNGFLIWLNLFTSPDIIVDIFQSQKSFLPVYFPVFEPGAEVCKGDRIVAKVWRKITNGEIYPDYGIEGQLIRQHMETISFSYVSERLPRAFASNAFYRRLFPDGALQVRPSLSVKSIQAYLAERLPAYMVPASFIELKRFPLTPNGKVDRKALSEKDGEKLLAARYVAPRNQMEQKVATVWKSILGIERVGVYDNFFDLGGHSLLATRVATTIRKDLDLALAIADIFTHATVEKLAAHLQTQVKKPLSLPLVHVHPRPLFIPLSFSQERLWFIHQLEGSIQYHVPAVLRLKGHLDTVALEHALKALVNRHEVLRTVIKEHAGQAYQQVMKPDGWTLSILTAVHDQPMQQVVESLTSPPFNLSQDYTLRAGLVGLKTDEHLLVLTLHHIASDGWSMPVIVRELSELYSAHVAHRQPQLAELPVQYADYAIWQRQYFSDNRLAEQLPYWQHQLQGLTPLQLPTDFTRPPVPGVSGRCIHFSISKALTERLRHTGKVHEATMFMTLQAAFSVLLHRYSGQEDICVGSAFANRTHHETDGLVGFFANTLALRNKVSSGVSFTALLEQVKQTTLAAYAHQEVPFEKVVDAVATDRDVARAPLFQVMFDLQNNEAINDLGNRLTGVLLSVEEAVQATAKFDLSFSVTEEASGGLHGSIEYRTDLYLQETIQRMVGHYRQLLESVADDPQQKIGDLNLLGASERRRLLEEFSGGNLAALPAATPADTTFIHLFEQQAALTPYLSAVISAEGSLSYHQLNERAGHFARQLISSGVGCESLVPLCMHKGADLVVAILAIFKTGGAYVPIDPRYPSQRIAFMLADTAATVVVTDKACAPAVAAALGSTTTTILEVDGQWQRHGDSGTDPGAAPALKGHHLAYVIYTSGSTGTPKGVMVTHQNLLHYLSVNAAAYLGGGAGVGSGTFVHLSCSFDASVTALFMPLLQGSSLVIGCGEGVEAFEDGLFMRHAPYRFLKLTPAHLPLLQLAVAAGGGVMVTQRLVVGGEALEWHQVQWLYELGMEVEVINEYGPTEATVGCCRYSFSTAQPKPQGQSIPIGRPMAGTRLYILDDQGGLCPVGVVGELYIGGAGVARGYLKGEGLEVERFVCNGYGVEGERVYRTGDMVRWHPEGDIGYIGRRDQQVKVKGYRIELGEIEQVLSGCVGLREGVVLYRRGERGEEGRLECYVVGEVDEEGVLGYLGRRLPWYMVPSKVVVMEVLPLTVNGKVDRQRLLLEGEGREKVGASGAGYVGPRNAIEEQLAQIWQELLEVERAGVHDNFFELGGDSIKIISLVSKIKEAFGKEVKMFDVYQSASLQQLAVLIGNASGKPHSSELYDKVSAKLAVLKNVVLAQRDDALMVEDIYPMSDIQKGMVYTALVDPALGVYHDQMVYPVAEGFRAVAFEKALDLMVKKHSILRTAFNLDSYSESVQIVYKTIPVEVTYLSLQQSNEEELRTCIGDYLKKDKKIPFDIHKAPLWRAAVFSAGMQTRFVFQCHHAILDGWSVAAFNTELNNLYLSLPENSGNVSLPPLKCSQRDYIIESIMEKEHGDSRAFWQRELSGYKRLDLFSQEPTYERFVKTYPVSYLKKLRNKTLEDKITLKGLFFASYIYAVKLLSYESDITVGLVGNTRPALKDGDKILGCFLNTVPFRIIIDQRNTWKEFFTGVEDKLRAFKERDRTSLAEITKTQGAYASGDNPFFDTLFDFLNFHIYEDIQAGFFRTDQMLTAEGEADQDDFLTNDSTNTFLDSIVSVTGDTLIINYILRRKLKSGRSVKDLNAFFNKVLDCYLNHYDEVIQHDALLGAAERRLLEEFSGGNLAALPAATPANTTFIHLFEQQAALTPHLSAVISAEGSLSYHQLNERAGHFARQLISSGVGCESLVPLCMHKGANLVVAILAIFKAGGAYVPIDPRYPSQRIAFMLADTAATVVVTDKACAPAVAAALGSSTTTIVELDGQWQRHGDSGTDPGAAPALKGHHLAYVIYTSGSTGTPKGVMVTHQNLLHYLSVNAAAYLGGGAGVGSGTFVHLSCSFDASVTALFMPLLQGSSLVIGCGEGVEAFEDVLFMRHAPYRFLKLTPAHLPLLQLAVAAGGGVMVTQRLVVGGEALEWHQVQWLYELGMEVEVINEYGPTEATVGCCRYSFSTAQPKPQGQSIPIGRPMAGTRLYILDDQGGLCPVGVVGELYIGGAGVARGYLKGEGLEVERFVCNGYGVEGERVYRTGDMVRWHPEGDIGYIGRRDQQVKVKGYRIELGEIEQVMSGCVGLREGVVLYRRGDLGEEGRLECYVVGEVDEEGVMGYLGRRLPWYMVPSKVVVMEVLPLTVNGKVDRQRLLLEGEGREKVGASGAGYVGPRNAIEEQLAQIWQELLEVERAGVHDNFFELGGDSILAIRFISAVRRKLEVEVSINDFFQITTIEMIAKYISVKKSNAVDETAAYESIRL